MPCTQAFDAQDEVYRESVLPAGVTARVAVEAGVADYWYKYVGLNGKIIGVSRFGESAPGGTVLKHLGFTAENIVKAVEKIL
jgi:transketolase